MSKFWFKQKRTASTSSRSRSYVLIPFIIALLIIPGDLMAKKSGAQLLIEKRDQQQLKGELISVDVEEESLVLRTDDGGVKIYTDEIESIRVKRKLTGRHAAWNGFLIGAGIGVGAALVFCADPHGELMVPQWICMSFVIGIFGFLGGLFSGTAGTYKKKMQVKGRSQTAIKKILKRLKKRALIKN